MATTTATDEGRHVARAGSLTVADLLERTLDTERGTRAARGQSGGTGTMRPPLDLFAARLVPRAAPSETDHREPGADEEPCPTRSVVQLMPAAGSRRPAPQVLDEVRQQSLELRRQRNSRFAATFAAAAAVVALASVGSTSLLAEPSPARPGALAADPAVGMTTTATGTDGATGAREPSASSGVPAAAAVAPAAAPTADAHPESTPGAASNPIAAPQSTQPPTGAAGHEPAAGDTPPEGRSGQDGAAQADPADPAVPAVRDFFESLPAEPSQGENLLGPLPSILDPVGLVPSWDQVSRVQPTDVARVDDETLQVTSLVYRDDSATLEVRHLVTVTEQPDHHVLDGELVTGQVHE